MVVSRVSRQTPIKLLYRKKKYGGYVPVPGVPVTLDGNPHEDPQGGAPGRERVQLVNISTISRLG